MPTKTRSYLRRRQHGISRLQIYGRARARLRKRVATWLLVGCCTALVVWPVVLVTHQAMPLAVNGVEGSPANTVHQIDGDLWLRWVTVAAAATTMWLCHIVRVRK